MEEIIVNGLVDIVCEALLPQFDDLFEVAKKMSDDKKKKRETFKIIDKAKTSGGLSDKLYDTLEEKSNGNCLLQFDMISTAVMTNKWINYALWCMTELDNENLILLKANNDQMEFVNAICQMAGFGKIYESAGYCNLENYAVENKDREAGSKFLFSLEDLKEKVFDEKFIKAMQFKKAKILTEASRALPMNSNFFGTNSRIDHDGLIHPIFFSSTPLINDIGPKQGEGISNDLFARLENSLSGYIRDEKYSYNIDANTGLPMLTIMRDNSYGATESFIIDDGTVMGGTGIWVLGKYMNSFGVQDYIFVNVVKSPGTVYNIINRSFYQLNAAEVADAFSAMLQNYSIYNAIDMSGTYWLDYLNAGERKMITDHLSNIIGFMSADQNLWQLPRLRFSEYINPNNFTLVSDNKVKSPFAITGFTSSEICEGLSFVCKDGAITQYFSTVPNAKYIPGAI